MPLGHWGGGFVAIGSHWLHAVTGLQLGRPPRSQLGLRTVPQSPNSSPSILKAPLGFPWCYP